MGIYLDATGDVIVTLDGDPQFIHPTRSLTCSKRSYIWRSTF